MIEPLLHSEALLVLEDFTFVTFELASACRTKRVVIRVG